MSLVRNRAMRLFFVLMSLTTTVRIQEAAAAQLTLGWTDMSANEDGFKVERKAGTTGTFVQLAMVGANVTSYADGSVTGGATYCYRVQAYNMAGNSGYTNEACGTASADTQVPIVSLSAPTNGITVSGASVTVSALASDNVGVVGVQFLLDGSNLGSEDTTTPYSISWNSTTAANGSHTLTARARDAAGNQTTSTAIVVTVSNTAQPPPDPSGLVAAFSFDEGSGSTVGDVSSTGNTGAVSGASWTTQGKFGSALSFDGVNDWVTINDTNALDLTTGMTLEAWVYPTVAQNSWRGIIQKEQSGGIAYYLHANSDVNQPAAGIFIGNEQQLKGGAQLTINAWTHLATTYDGMQMRLYVNGVQVASRAQSGAMATSTGVLRIGGNSVWGEHFQGLIDNVRVYNRALSPAEIQANMNTPVGSTPPPPSPISHALTLAKAGLGSGAVTSSPAGVNCGATCTASYTDGTTVALTATPAAGSTFAGWSGDADCSDGSVTMTAAKSCIAMFNLLPPTTYSLSITKTGTGSGSVTSSPAGINCGAICSAAYTSGTAVFLTATPAAGSTFAGWSGNADCSDGSVTMVAAKSCTATFLKAGIRIGIYRPSTGQWFLDVNGNGAMDDCSLSGCVAHFGDSNELPVVGDWDGTGTTKLGVFNPNTRMWKLDRNGDDMWVSGIDLSVGPFGQVGDLPVVGDWNGSGITKLGVKRPTKSRWELDFNGNGKWDGCKVDLCGSLGGAVQPLVGDWNGLSDGVAKDMIGFFLPGKTSQWKLDLNDNRAWNSGVDLLIKSFGQTGDVAVVGDWDGSGVTKIGVFDPTTGLWELDSNGNEKWEGCAVDTCLGPFGQSGDLPVVGKW